ncbi:hypothetical protein [Candidatus Nanohalobium constans]|uniref:Homoserine kinase-like protein n=1 Tax=Candidatus Nanohalobium constans TaxID=2565781 RepID=A0A5Q0UHG8_9ARCH|nr:hypothetical protein [Candidatus Nanohalobium constans]QGA80339.1 homoserine kinase-like protein [Candidatus Nanohalobium constans]
MTDLGDHGIEPQAEDIEYIANRLILYTGAVDNVHESLKELDEVTVEEPEYSEIYSDIESFFIHSNPYWTDSENPEKAYLNSREDLPISDEVEISSTKLQPGPGADNAELGLYAEMRDGEATSFWRLDYESGKSIEDEENIILETARSLSPLHGENEGNWNFEELND